jgi:hypothetical protein
VHFSPDKQNVSAHGSLKMSNHYQEYSTGACFSRDEAAILDKKADKLNRTKRTGLYYAVYINTRKEFSW